VTAPAGAAGSTEGGAPPAGPAAPTPAANPTAAAPAAPAASAASIPAVPATATAAPPPAPGTLDRPATRRAIEQRRFALQECVDRGRMDNPQLAGDTLVLIDISGDGRVIGARFVRSALKNRAVESCILSAIQTWTLPAPAGGVPATFKYPFTFR